MGRGMWRGIRAVDVAGLDGRVGDASGGYAGRV